MGQSSINKVIELYSKLVNLYTQKTESKPFIASLVSRKYLFTPRSTTSIPLYQKVYRDVFVFYVLCSHNTRDGITQSIVKRLVEHLDGKNYCYTYEDFRDFFYKHKDRNVEALKKIITLLENPSVVFFKQFLEIPGVGVKTTSLIWNQFVESYVYPVVDVNVHKAALCLLPEIPQSTADKLFNLFCQLDGTRCGFSYSYDLSSLLYYHRKRCLTNKKGNKGRSYCDRTFVCEICKPLVTI